MSKTELEVDDIVARFRKTFSGVATESQLRQWSAIIAGSIRAKDAEILRLSAWIDVLSEEIEEMETGE